MTTKNEKKLKRAKMAEARRTFTRDKAEKALSAGADPTERRFTHHVNYHVRYKAWMKSGGAVPGTPDERTELLERLTKGCSDAYVARMKTRLEG